MHDNQSVGDLPFSVVKLHGHCSETQILFSIHSFKAVIPNLVPSDVLRLEVFPEVFTTSCAAQDFSEL